METQPVLDVRHPASARRLAGPVRDRRAWMREALGPEDRTVTLPPAVQEELARAGDPLRANPLPIPLLHPGLLDLPHGLSRARGLRAAPALRRTAAERAPVGGFSRQRGPIPYLSTTDTARFRSPFGKAEEPERKQERLEYR